MTDKYTLEEIEAAIRTKTELLEPVGIGMNHFTRTILDELTRPKPSFREGEVYAVRITEGHEWEYRKHREGQNCGKAFRRTLTLTEHGPAVKALRDAAEKYICCELLSTLDDYHGRDALVLALAAFDAAMGDDDE